MSSRAARGQVSLRRASRRRARNGWLTLLSIIGLALLVEVTVHLIDAPRHAASHAQTIVKTVASGYIPPGCGVPDPLAQQQATAALPSAVTPPAGSVPMRVVHDANGTLIVICAAATPQVSHDMLQHAMLTHGWQSASDIIDGSILSSSFLHDGVVVFVTIAAQQTTPPTTQIVMTLPR